MMRRDRLRTTRTQDGRKTAVWQLVDRAPRILRAQFIFESFTAYRLPAQTPLPEAQAGTIMFEPYPDLVTARELLPKHADLWDALRDDYWAALTNTEDLPKSDKTS